MIAGSLTPELRLCLRWKFGKKPHVILKGWVSPPREAYVLVVDIDVDEAPEDFRTRP